MSALTSLLARDHVVPVRKIEEALQKQVVSGGDITSVLLELDAIAENTLAAYGAALYGRLPATRDEIMRAPRDVVRVVPREVAEKHRLVPVAIDATSSGAAGPTLIVALAMPLSQPVEQQLSFLLGRTLVSRVVCEVRIAAALAHHYSIEPAPRMRRLIERLRERDAGPVPYVAPPETGKVTTGALSGLARKSSAGSFLDDEPDDSIVPEQPRSSPPGRPSGVPPNDGRSTDPHGVPPPGGIPRVPTVPPPYEERTVVDPMPEAAPSVRPAKVLTRPPPRPVSVLPPADPAPERHAMPPRALAPAPVPRSLAADDPSASGTLPDRARKLRGPLTAAQAVQQLESVEERDALLDVVLAFVQQFFDYVATFVVHEDVAEARASRGEGTSARELRGTKFSLGPSDTLDAPRGLLAEARARSAPALATLDRDEVDVALASNLGQAASSTAIAVPVVLRKRVVLIVLGVRAGERFEIADVPELVGLAPRIADALERVIRQRKQRGFSSSSSGTNSSGGTQAAAAPERAALKAAVSQARDSTAPRARSRSADRWSAGGGEAEAKATPSVAPAAVAAVPSSPPVSLPAASPDRSLADAILAGATEDGAPIAISAPLPEGPRPRNLLGIPRSAPPPPDASFLVPVVTLPPRGPSERPGRGLLSAFDPLDPGRITDPAPPPAAVAQSNENRDDDEPMLSVEGGDDDEPEVSFGDDDGADDWGDDEDEEEERPRTTLPSPTPAVSSVPPAVLIAPTKVSPEASGYSMRDLDEEVVIPLRKRSRSSAPPPADETASERASKPTPPASIRPVDPRREEGSGPDADRVPMAAVERISERPPPSSAQKARMSTPPREVPSVIVDMGDAVDNLVVDLQHAGPDDERAAVNALLRLGEAALPVLAQTFPGPLWFDRHRPHRRAPRGRDTCAIARAFYAFGVRATPYVATLTGSSNPEKRYYALLLAGDMVHPSLLDAVVARVFDEDETIRKLSHEIVPRFKGLAGWDEQLSLVRRGARVRGKDPRKRIHALQAVAAMRDAGALRMLVELLEDDDRDVVRHAHLTLIALTAEDLGTSARKWANWVDKNDSRHRVEWLIDALTHSDEALRTAAGEELKQVTQQYFGFHPGTTRREREVAQNKYRAWWLAEGKKQFH